VSRVPWPALALVAGALVLGCGPDAGLDAASSPPAAEWEAASPPPAAESVAAAWAPAREIVIPVGAQARLDAGERVAILETEIRVKVGETVRIRNDDVVDHVIGPYYLQSGAALQQTYRTPQTIQYVCFVNPTEAINLVVEPE
jgi:multidrug efflux pump subunit AcrA (membrane-fusion protein)